MKTCPNCNEIVGDNVDICFKCGYDFIHKRMPTREEIEAKQNNEKQIMELHRIQEEKRKQQAIDEVRISNKVKYQIEEELSLKNDESAIIALNDIYEYRVLKFSDDSSGIPNIAELEKALNDLSLHGWHLKSAHTNEIGKNSVAVGLGGASNGSNATIDVTVLIFERCIKRYSDAQHIKKGQAEDEVQ